MEKVLLKDFYDYKRMANLKLSPDKQHAGFIVETVVDDKYVSHIWILNTKTKEYSKLTAGRSFFWVDNSTIAFPSLRNADLKQKTSEGEIWREYYTIDINTKEEKVFLQIPAKVTGIATIDDDNFVITATYNMNDISLYGLEGEERAAAIQEKKDEDDYILLEEIPYCSNGAGYVSRNRNRLYTFKKSTCTLTAITDELTDVVSYKYNDGKILYTAKTFDRVKPDSVSFNTYDIDAEENTILVPQGECAIRNFHFVGDKLVVTMSDEKDYGLGQYEDFYTFEDGKFTLLCEHDTGFGTNVGSDCKIGGRECNIVYNDALYFISTIRCGAYINKLTLDGELTQVTANNGEVGFFGILDDGEIIFSGLRGTRLHEIYSLKDGVETQITTFNEFMQEKSICKPETISFVDPDGIEIEGFVIKPADFVENKTYPGILTIHGGPRSVFGDVFFHQMQVWANQGYFVFFCNPRGSDGRDSEFQEVRGKFGTVEYNNVMQLTDTVIAKYPQLDANRLGVTGASYGGFMTSWIVGHTDRFKCAIIQHAVASWMTQFGTSDVGYNSSASKSGATPWTDIEKMWWHSPLKYADKISCPILSIYSEKDYRVCLSEGIQMFTALKFLENVPVKMRIFKDEAHGLTGGGQPKHRIVRMEEILNWFDTYLK